VGTALRIAVAIGAVYLIFRVGLAMLKSFARPVPEPPPPGEMRRVKLRYRCALCGMEIRVDRGNSSRAAPGELTPLELPPNSLVNPRPRFSRLPAPGDRCRHAERWCRGDHPGALHAGFRVRVLDPFVAELEPDAA